MDDGGGGEDESGGEEDEGAELLSVDVVVEGAFAEHVVGGVEDGGGEGEGGPKHRHNWWLCRVWLVFIGLVVAWFLLVLGGKVNLWWCDWVGLEC